MPHIRFRPATLALLMLALLALPPAPAGAEGAPLRLEVRDGAFVDWVELRPFDPRAPALSAERPDAARGIHDGRLSVSGGLVRLVETPEGLVGLVVLPNGLSWVREEGGVLVPHVLTLPEGAEGLLDKELQAPLQPASAPDAGKDGVLQIMLDGDYEYYQRYGDGWDDHQLAVISLVDAIFVASLGVPIEVVEQHVWTESGVLVDPIRCSGTSDDLLEQFRAHWESVRPTEQDEREAAHLFSRKTPIAHPGGLGRLIGCGYLETLESPYAYAATWMGVYTSAGVPAMQINTLYLAHELGHNFGGLHERALPTPGGPFDHGGCTGATIMYPSLCENAPRFSEVPGDAGAWASVGLVQDGGNVPWMRAHAGARI